MVSFTFKLLDPWSIVKTPKPSPPTEQLWVWTGESGSTLSGSTTVTSPTTSPTAALLLTYVPYTGKKHDHKTSSLKTISAYIWLQENSLLRKSCWHGHIFSCLLPSFFIFIWESVLFKKSGRILLPLNTPDPRFSHFIIYMYNFDTKNSFLAKYLTSLGFKEILLGFSFKLRTLKMKLLEKDNPPSSVLLMVTLYWDFSS